MPIRTCTLLLPLLCLLTPARASVCLDEEKLQVEVVAVTGDAIYLDEGRSAGIREQDVVWLFPDNEPMVEAVIVYVSQSRSRATPVGPRRNVAVGTRAEVHITEVQPDASSGSGPDATPDPGPNADPASRLKPPSAPAAPPEHPAWSTPPENWDRSRPLLSPTRALEPEERAYRIRGSWHARTNYTFDDATGRRQIFHGGAGLDLRAENPLGKGGELDIDLNMFHRVSNTNLGPDDEDTRVRLDRFSYRLGGVRNKPERFELGRFLQDAFPEFGLLDGVEWSQRLASGLTMGLSAGHIPEPSDDWKSGDDWQVAAFALHETEDRDVTLALGVQKTWHNGEADRDLIVGRASWSPTERSQLFVRSWIDVYDSNDVIKSQGPELTQLQVDANVRNETGAGVGLFYSRYRWPEILRQEFSPQTAETISRNRFERLGLRAFAPLTGRIRLDGRIERWDDRGDDGGNFDLRVSLRDFAIQRSSTTLSAFGTVASEADSLGLRAGFGRFLDDGSSFDIAYDVTAFDHDTLLGGSDDPVQHALRGTYDRSLGQAPGASHISLFAERRFGDDQDSWTIGLYIQKRF